MLVLVIIFNIKFYWPNIINIESNNKDYKI